MHAFRYKSEVVRFVCSAWLLLGLWCGVVAAALGLIAAIIAEHHEWMLYALLGLLLLGMLALLWLLTASRARCPLCIARPLFPERCSQHRHAAVWLGSPQLPVAFSIAFGRKFRCPYCGERASLRVRQRGFRSRT